MQKWLDISGPWDILIDFEEQQKTIADLEVAVGWEPIQVPGCWELVTANKAADGPVYYRKEVYIPSDWKSHSVLIDFQGVNYYCQVWLNETIVGEHEGGWNAFSLCLDGYLRYGANNLLIVKVFKQGVLFPMRESLAGFLPDVAVMFGGIWKPVKIRIVDKIEITDLFARQNVSDSLVDIGFSLKRINETSDKEEAIIEMEICDQEGNSYAYLRETAIFPCLSNDALHSTRIHLPASIPLWHPDHPALLELTVSVYSAGEKERVATQRLRFGMREIQIKNGVYFLNNHAIYLRGVLHWGWYDNHIAPIPTSDEIREEFSKIKNCGFNIVKLCLFVATQEYYDLADEMGILIWQELPIWLPDVTINFKRRAILQYDRIIREIRNHPSIILWTLGCELNASVDADFLTQLFTLAKNLTGGAVIRDNSGSGECYGGQLNENADFYDYHFYTDIHFYADLLHEFAASWRPRKPWLFGEFCDYDTFRNLKKVKALYEGANPWWLQDDSTINPVSMNQTIAYWLQQSRMDRLTVPFTVEELDDNARRSAWVYRKAVLEYVRSYANIQGYVITSIRDTPLATSGIFDDMGLPKHEPRKLQQIHADTIVVLTWDAHRNWVNGGDRRIRRDNVNYTSGDSIRCHLLISHYGQRDIVDGSVQWSVCDVAGSEVLEHGVVNLIAVVSGSSCEVGVIECIAPKVSKPTKIMIFVQLQSMNVEIANNEWELWIFPEVYQAANVTLYLRDLYDVLSGIAPFYPDIKDFSNWRDVKNSHVLLTSVLGPEELDYLESGGHVLYIQRNNGYFPILRKPFWRESLQLFRDHAVMNLFPHEGHTGLVWSGLASDTIFDTASLPKHTPMMERLDARTFTVGTYMFEANIGKGRLIATTLRLEGGLGSQPTGIENHPVARYLLNTFISYLSLE